MTASHAPSLKLSGFFSFCTLALCAGLALNSGCVKKKSEKTAEQAAQLEKTDVETGTGEEAIVGKTVTVDYTGKLTDGKTFDTSVGKTPFVFKLGAGDVIKGWDEGVVGMKVGGTRKLVIPPELAYGDRDLGAIPPKSTLVFEVKLLKVQ